MEAQKASKPIKMIPVKAGEYVHVPVFTCEEVASLSPEEMLKRVRDCHIKHGQFDILEAIDKRVEERGNPYGGRQLFPKPKEA